MIDKNILAYWRNYNLQFIALFESNLTFMENLHDRTVEKHIDNIDFFGNFYLLKIVSNLNNDPLNVFGEIITLPKATGKEIKHFLGNYLIIKDRVWTESLLLSYIRSLKKFYKFLKDLNLYLGSEKDYFSIFYYLKKADFFIDRLKRYNKIIEIDDKEALKTLLTKWEMELNKI